MEVPREIINNILIDFKKKEIDKWDKAKFLKDVCTTFNLSMRKLSEIIDVPHNTLQDWMMYARFTKEEYQTLEAKGLGRDDLRLLIRDNKTQPKSRILNKPKIDIELEKARKLLNPLLTANKDSTIGTIQITKDLINTLNRILMKLEKKHS